MTKATIRNVTEDARMADAPALIRFSNPLTRWLLRRGMPMGPNGLITVRGRSSGEPRTAPVAVAEIDGRRYVIGSYGEVNWVRNLRAAGEADLQLHGRTEHVMATELDQSAAMTFFGRTVPGYLARFPWLGRSFLRVLFALVAPQILGDSARAAASRPVFELHVPER
jgi:deazaflavin-dependent oxidoreductase (nitroreductase family)